MKSFRLSFPLVAVALTVAGCASAPDIKTDYNRSADFSAYRSFGFVEHPGTDRQGYESLTTQYLKGAVQREMTARGYRYAQQSPDLLVNFNTRLQEKVQVSPAPAPMMGYYGYRGGLYAPWPGYGFYNDVYTYTEGTLNIDLVDARQKKLVWEGVAVGSVDTGDKTNAQQRIDKVVGQIFAKYPFRAGQ
ncbi:DUF4136 domain-containing protein [Cupriavidus sp. L7L]|uniref:DUF4136 domain-containing protein n=1 Tax=Cupriavidus sp. L7L TaxID=2546443 RepID=UPI00105562F3|nr:DUF4136 domain-containing protein [Cupriavidus sp. L7L]TDF63104.1 DUF4136 domain-containing protein [Cupriavidus sp. L7L]